MSFLGGAKKFLKRATTLPKSVRKINIGHTVRAGLEGTLQNVEDDIRSAAGGIRLFPQTVDNVNRAAQTTQMLPWILVGGIVVVILLMRRR